MKVHLRAFSYLREYLPANSAVRGDVELDFSEQATLKDLFISLGLDRRLGTKIFDAPVDHTFQVLINRAAVSDFEHPLAEGDEIVLFPPMAGG